MIEDADKVMNAVFGNRLLFRITFSIQDPDTKFIEIDAQYPKMS